MHVTHQAFDASKLPHVGGVCVYLSHTVAALQAFLTDLQHVRAQLERASASLELVKPNLLPRMARRADHMLAAMSHDWAVMKDVCAPIADAVAREPLEDDLVGWASIQTGSSLHDMFVYFYQDWLPLPEFDKVKGWFREAVDAHCQDRSSVAVLGAGACGLVHSLAHQFEQTYAVDISLPTLLLAKRFFAGERVALHFKGASWARAELEAPPPPPHPVSLVAANATNMPFRDQSLACVVTQCMFDLVDNPLHLAEEIHRVLQPNGIWLNFSHAFDAPGDVFELCPRKLEEVPMLLEPRGFDVVSLQRRRFVMLDRTELAPECSRTEDDVQFFTMRKANGRTPIAQFRRLRARFESADPSLWQVRPRTIRGQEVSIARRQTFGIDGVADQSELRVGPYAMPISERSAQVLGALLARADGRRSLRSIFDDLTLAGVPLSPSEFLRLVFCLSVERYLLELHEG